MSDPIITLAGKEYAVPPLVPRQLRHVIPRINELRPLIGTERKINLEDYPKFLENILPLIYWGAIWPNDKKASEESIEDIPVTNKELFNAITVIIKQTGLFMAAPEGATPGEASAEAPIPTT
jgi:hypothetical protein